MCTTLNKRNKMYHLTFDTTMTKQTSFNTITRRALEIQRKNLSQKA